MPVAHQGVRHRQHRLTAGRCVGAKDADAFGADPFGGEAKADEGRGENGAGGIALKKWNPDTPYLKEMKRAKDADEGEAS